MPTIVSILTITGLALHLPAIAIAVVLLAAGRQTGQHAGNAALALAIPFVIAAVVALLGALMTLGTGTWSLASDAGRAAGWGWVRWSSVAVIVGWVVALGLLFLRK